MFLGGNYLESVGITGNLLYYTQGSVLLFKGAFPPVCSTVRHCAAHCTEQMYAPVETDERTATNCTRTIEKSARTAVNMCARTQLSVYTF